MASTAPADTPEDQQYICNEFQRQNTLMLELSKLQQELSERKIIIEREIMAKGGVDDGDLWTDLIEVREKIDGLAQEKLLLIAKLYNLA